MIKQCEWCKELFEYEPKNKGRPRKFCTLKCKSKSVYEASKTPIQPKQCEFCGETFQPKTRGKRYCSAKCLRQRDYYAHHEERKARCREDQRKKRAEDPEGIRKKSREWNAAHREQIRAYYKEYYKKNKEAVDAKNKERYEKRKADKQEE